MKAVVYRSSQRLVYEEVEKPAVAQNQVLLKVMYAGFCGSDHSMVYYDFLPDGTILGHELSGVVAEFGSEVNGVSIGERYIVRTTFCGKCKYCLQGKTHLCINRVHVGKEDLGGGFAEYMVVYPQMLIPIPNAVDYRRAAMTEMYASALHGIYVTGVTGGSALVIGGGPIGLCTVELLKQKGFGPIILSEPVQGKRELGLGLGATKAVNPFAVNLLSEARTLSGDDGFDVVFECSGIPSNFELGLDCLNRGGTLSFVSAIPTEVSFSPMGIMVGVEKKIVGVGSSNHDENKEVLTLMAQGKIDGNPLISDDITLDELPRIYEERIDKKLAIKVMIKTAQE